MPPAKFRRFDNVNEWFWDKIDRTGDCWLATGGSVGVQGHRIYWMDSRHYGAHVISWMIANGPVPDGFWVLHRCNNGQCVNPVHLYLGDNSRNVLDQVEAGTHNNARKTHCKNGHEFTPENTRRVSTRPTRRICRTCEGIRGGYVSGARSRKVSNLGQAGDDNGNSACV